MVDLEKMLEEFKKNVKLEEGEEITIETLKDLMGGRGEKDE